MVKTCVSGQLDRAGHFNQVQKPAIGRAQGSFISLTGDLG
jgi:hypothetical protein